VTVPASAGPQAGLSKGALVDNEYTKAQRRMIDLRLEAAAAEVRKGNVSAAFDNITDFAASLTGDAGKSSTNTKRSSRR